MYYDMDVPFSSWKNKTEAERIAKVGAKELTLLRNRTECVRKDVGILCLRRHEYFLIYFV